MRFLQRAPLMLLLAFSMYLFNPAVAPAEESKDMKDAEHALLFEAMDVVDRHFIDLSNKEGVARSSELHEYNSVSWEGLKKELEEKKLENRKETYKEIKKVLKKLGDRYTRFLPPSEFVKLTKYDATGVGLAVNQDEQGLLIGYPPLAGSTAADAGVQKGDRLVSIDGVAMKGLTPFDATEMLQGVKGSKVSIEVERKTNEGQKIVSFELERKISVENPVSSTIFESQDGKKVGYIKLKEFNGASRRGVEDAIKSMEPLDDIILDLRGNLGGVLEGSLQIAAAFVDEDGKPLPTLVNVIDRKGKEEPVTLKSRETWDLKSPMLVLVDDKSASASEVLAGSLKDNCRAVVVGNTHSYGKGLIQGVYPLSDGSGLIVTVAKYLTPKHQEINGVGIVPDVKQKVGDVKKAIKNGKLNLDAAAESLKICKAS